MAVIPTGALYNTLTFGGVNSGTYGIYITGEGVYNSPERAVELTAVPGRNGAVPVDLGRWENIEVIYKASTGQDSQVDFRTAVADFRNAIGSLRGYQRLEDTYHPDEFRMGLFISGLDVEPTASGKAGEFELKFNCKPQRFLKSGEDPVTIADGGSITNPTSLNASPVIQLEGYGDMQIGDYSITLQNIPLGIVQVANSYSETVLGGITTSFNLDKAKYMPGDLITLSKFSLAAVFNSTKDINPISTSSSHSGDITADVLWGAVIGSGRTVPTLSVVTTAPITFTAGTGSTHSVVCNATFTATDSTTATVAVTITAEYLPGATDTIYIYATGVTPGFVTMPSSASFTVNETMADSTVPNTGHPAYIDCEIGEAYKIESGEMVSINGASFLGTDLPVLKPGANAISYDNTVTSFALVPRWWKL